MTAARPFANLEELASLIDHTLLKPDATEAEITTVCKQAVEFKFAAVCVNPYWVLTVAGFLGGSPVRTCSVISFPLGAGTTQVKVDEASVAIADGASEIDMVINIGALLSGHAEMVGREINELAACVHGAHATLKVIIEASLLSNDQKRLACQLAKNAAADFVKTSTGFSTGGATEADVALMRSVVGPSVGVKASGGIRTLDSLTKMVRAGASRIGASASVQILAEFQAGSY